jgi:hypothetical protein
MYKVIGLCVIFEKKLDGGTVRFIGENLGRAKGLKYLIFSFFFTGLFFDYGVSMGIRSG